MFRCEKCKWRQSCDALELVLGGNNIIPIIVTDYEMEKRGLLSFSGNRIDYMLFGEKCGIYIDRTPKTLKYKKCTEDCTCCKHRFLCYTVRRT